MVEPKCPNAGCGKSNFAVKTIQGEGQEQMMILYCTDCGQIIGTANRRH